MLTKLRINKMPSFFRRMFLGSGVLAIVSIIAWLCTYFGGLYPTEMIIGIVLVLTYCFGLLIDQKKQ